MQPVDGASAAETVSFHDDRRILRITLSDGRAVDLAADQLRMQCRCASCSRARIDGTFSPATQGIAIEQATPMGNYGLNLGFSDGHARGIFPFAYLFELATFEAAPGNTLAETDGIARRQS